MWAYSSCCGCFQHRCRYSALQGWGSNNSFRFDRYHAKKRALDHQIMIVARETGRRHVAVDHTDGKRASSPEILRRTGLVVYITKGRLPVRLHNIHLSCLKCRCDNGICSFEVERNWHLPDINVGIFQYALRFLFICGISRRSNLYWQACA